MPMPASLPRPGARDSVRRVIPWGSVGHGFHADREYRMADLGHHRRTHEADQEDVYVLLKLFESDFETNE